MSPILFDLQTLSFVLVLVTTFLSFVMIFVWCTQKTYAGFGWWVVSNIFVAAGVILLGINLPVADIAGTALTFGAVLIGYEGNRRFLKLKNTFSVSLSILILQILLLVYFKYFNENIVLQVSLTSLFVALISGYCAFLFAGNSSKHPNSSYRFTGTTYLIFALLMMSRSIVTYYFGSNEDFYKPDGIQPIFFMTYILFEIIWSFNYINLNSEHLQKELKAMQVELEKLATTDFLTGVGNNRQFFEISKNEILRARRFRHSLSLIMFDIDYFKNINDAYGHAGGDRVLIEVTDLCRKALRGNDFLARIGGEEFAVLLSNTDIDGAKIVAEYLRRTLEESEFEFLSEKIKITASFGVAGLSVADKQIETVLERADFALYEAKRKGRNQVVSEILNVNYAAFNIA